MLFNENHIYLHVLAIPTSYLLQLQYSNILCCYYTNIVACAPPTFLYLPSYSYVLCSVTSTGSKKDKKNTTATKTVVPHLEVSIEKLVRNKEAAGDEDEEGEGMFVEVAALPPAGVVRSAKDAGLEGTFFKTQVARGDSIDFQHRLVISPLPHSDGFLQVLVKQKHTYGDDVVMGERADILVSSFLKSEGSLVLTVGSFDLSLSAKYVSA